MLRIPRRALALPFRNVRFNSSVPAVTKIEKLILDGIKAVGPLSFSQYMQLCLSHPTEGYYMSATKAVIGKRGDFITSPEISQMFGELIGVWFSLQWLNEGHSSPIRVVELGPGRGTLMEDVLRVLRQLTPSDTKIERVHLVENSPIMRELQEQALAGGNWDLVWNDAVEEIEPSSNFTMVIAHEFFDALPINVLERRETGWHEVKIDAETTEEAYPRLRRVLSPAPTPISTVLAASSPRFESLPEGSHLEVSQTSFRTAHSIGKLLGSSGCALIVDYGADKPFGNSFRAFKAHQIVDVFETPGQCDLTANVDFGYLKEAMQDLPVVVSGPVSQGDFLLSMGIQVRLEALIDAYSPDDSPEGKRGLLEAAARLVHPAGMGKQYQVLGITTGKGNVYPFEIIAKNGKETK